jgi:hypothetical protein
MYHHLLKKDVSPCLVLYIQQIKAAANRKFVVLFL